MIFPEILTGVLVAIYFVMGFGCARMTAKIRDENVFLPEILLWPIVLLIYAVSSDWITE
jgi:hypothetical protein